MSDFTITVIDSENVIESTTTTVEIISVGMQGPSGPKGDPGDFDASIIVDMQNQVDNLESEVGLVRTLAQANDLKIGTKADQADLDVTDQQVEQNRLAILTKADIQALAQLALLVDTKADQSYVNQQIANLVGSAPEALNTIYELAAAIQNEQGLIDSLNQSVANRVRFDIATQALTEIQKQNARTNIDAEKVGTAQQLISQITAQSLGAATAAQGAKADTALQSYDVAPVAFTGSFTSLSNQNKIFDVVFTALQAGVNTGILVTDTLGQMLAKLQAQIDVKTSLILGEIATTAYRGDRGKTAYDHSLSQGNPHNSTTSDITEGSRLYFTDARVMATSLTGLSTSTGGVISATDTVLSALGKIQNQVTNSGGGSSSPTWVNITTVGTIPAYVTNADIQVARFQGMLWIRGTFNVNTTVSAYSELFRITDPYYKPYSYSTAGTARLLQLLSAWIPNLNSTKQVGISALGNITNSSQASTTNVIFEVRGTGISTTDGTINIPPTIIGTLVN